VINLAGQQYAMHPGLHQGGTHLYSQAAPAPATLLEPLHQAKKKARQERFGAAGGDKPAGDAKPAGGDKPAGAALSEEEKKKRDERAKR